MRVLLAVSLLLVPAFANADDFCVVYRSSEDVAHKPTDDVNLNSFDYEIPEKIVVPITKDFAGDMGFDMEMLSQMGELTVYSDGIVVLGDQDITAQAQSYCERTVNEDGQEGVETINSEPSENKVEEE